MPHFFNSAARFGIFAAASLALTAPAVATTASLRFDDLNMSTKAGQAAFERRAHQAVIEACGDPGVTGTRIVDPGFTKCSRDVRHQIDQQMARLATRSQLGG